MPDPASERATRWPWVLLAAAPSLVLVAWQASFVWPFFSDDAFISLRYSERLLAGEGLTWTDGERVEGYSNLLWVLGCSALGALGIDLVAAARALGGLCTVLAAVALARTLAPRDLRSTALAATVPLLALSTQVVMGWTASGLEGPLLFACLASGYGALQRRFAHTRAVASWSVRTLLAAGVPFALACWTRPDAPLWVATTALVLACQARGAGVGRAMACGLWFAALPVLAVGAQLAFRVSYYGDVVPNTAHVKAGFAASALPAGLDYVGAGLLAHLGLVLPATLGACWLARRRWPARPLVAWLALPLLAWFCYLAAIGGDHFPGRRLLHGAIAPMALLAAAWLLHGRRRGLVAATLLAGTGWNVYHSRHDAQSLELRGETWEWQGRLVGETLRTAFGAERPLVAVDAAGAIPFYSGLPSLDLLGLCDRTIARTPIPAWLDTVLPGTPRPPGHLHGNGRYVLERAPDVYLFGPPPGRPLPVFVSGAELEEAPGFLANHRLVKVELGAPMVLGQPTPTSLLLWLRLDGRVGVQRSRPPDERGERIRIPAWLFGAFGQTTPLVRRYQPGPTDAEASAAYRRQLTALTQWLTSPPSHAVPDAKGRLVAHFTAPTQSLRLPLERGVYRLAMPDGFDQLSLRCPDAGDGARPGTFVVRAPGEYELQLQIADGAALPVEVAFVELVRTDP